MKQSISHVALVVPDCDEAIAFFAEILHFTLSEDRFVPAEYGTVAVFRDLYGNLWDLVQRT